MQEIITIPDLNNPKFTWDIINLEILKQEASENNVVKLVDWVYTGNCYTNTQLTLEGMIRVYTTASISGNTTLGPPNPESFIPLNDLQKANVVSWLEATLDIPSMQANIVSQIKSIVLPPVSPTYNVTPSWGDG